jgi:hypothetical protein
MRDKAEIEAEVRRILPHNRPRIIKNIESFYIGYKEALRWVLKRDKRKWKKRMLRSS